MAEVFPQTSFWLFFDVPLSPNYENTFYFANATEQQNYFLTTFSNIVFSAQSYQRKSRGRIRVKANYGQVYNANYLAFINMNSVHTVGTVPSYEQKRYYCFVTDVEYVNDAVCDIYYTLDVLQSFMFDWQFEQAMVERETTASDNLHEHLIDEGLPVGDYTFYNFSKLLLGHGSIAGDFTIMYYVVAATVNQNYEDSTTEGVNITQVRGGIITGCNMLFFNTANDCVTWLNGLPGGKEDAILGVYIVPAPIVGAGHNGETALSGYRMKDVQNLAGYIPKNKKLLSAPYNTCYVCSSDGSSLVLDYRKANAPLADDRIMFTFDFAYTPPIQGFLYPSFYDGGGQWCKAPYSLPLPMVPTCTWANDTYKAWAALNTGYMVTSMAGSALDIVLKGAGAFLGLKAAGAIGGGTQAVDAQMLDSGVPVESSISTGGTKWGEVGKTALKNAGGLIGDIQNIANNFIAMHNAQIQPDSFNGSAQSLAVFAGAAFGYYTAQRCIRPEYAKILDEFFTMFGYKVLTIKTPSIHNRTRFTYVKTSNLDIKGRIPSVYRRQICDIFNAGIRWWVDRAHIGDYSYINAPLQ
jgi:hypothetical protein